MIALGQGLSCHRGGTAQAPVEPAWPVRFEIPLHVEEAASVSREAWPVSSGVPFKRGALPDVDRLRLVDPRGAVLPLQARALARWDDGSVRWALLDFIAATERGRTTTYSLQVGASAAP